MDLKNVTLEMSLKPFKKLDGEYLESVCTKLFKQWYSLLKHADIVSVLLWTADGSEILDYKGNMADEIEWARYIGGANPKDPLAGDPEGKALHSRSYLYMANPPKITYGDLKRIIQVIKHCGNSITGKEIRVGATFDPGPEFAKSSFKYERHPEICLAETMGRGQNGFVACITHLNEDATSYAGFPGGIPQGMHLGTFFGGQCQCFLSDMACDYIWFSNGFGFGTETWKIKGELFDGKTFNPSRSKELSDQILEFWKCFREKCPEYLVETRGTNLTVGVDLATDGVPHGQIYSGGFNMIAPPNSPWAAMDGDFGLELCGYMSRISKLPNDHCEYPFRFYVHDPWWLNSPWLDRYERQFHDIYMPMSVARLDDKGRVQTFNSIEFLTVDDSYGQMPDKCPNEIIPCVLDAYEKRPDKPGPLVWVYPFEEYHKKVFGEAPKLEEVFFGDWFIRESINCGLPLNTVVSSDDFICHIDNDLDIYDDSILFSIVPSTGSELARVITKHVKKGGSVVFYGPTTDADPEIMKILNLKHGVSLAGELNLSLSSIFDNTKYPSKILHEELLSGGACCELIADKDIDTKVVASVVDNNTSVVYSVCRTISESDGSKVAWIRGSNLGQYQDGLNLLNPLDPEEYFNTGMLSRMILREFGFDISIERENITQKSSMFTLSRNNNGFYISGFSPNTLTKIGLRFPDGIPLLQGLDTKIHEGMGYYSMPKSWRYECRVFVKQEKGCLRSKEMISGEIGVKRRVLVTGLKNADLVFYPETQNSDNVRMLLNPQWPFMDGDWQKYEYDSDRECCILKNITGDLQIIW